MIHEIGWELRRSIKIHTWKLDEKVGMHEGPHTMGKKPQEIWTNSKNFDEEFEKKKLVSSMGIWEP